MSANRGRQVVNAERLDEKVALMKTINQQLGELYRNTFDDTGSCEKNCCVRRRIFSGFAFVLGQKNKGSL